MKKYLLIISCFTIIQFSFGQNIEYSGLVKKADSLYNAKNYNFSALAYSAAFKANGWIGSSNDRYNAACSWALADNSDSSFFQLYRIATKANYKNYEHISTDADLNFLHDDKRWKPLLEIIKQNKERAEANLNKPLVAELDSIYTEDQKYRLQIEEIKKQYGSQSNEMRAHWKIINKKDSINLVKIKSILDKYGWLGADVIGEKGNSTLFLVIQHSDIGTQEKYLPVIRNAVKNDKANGSALALLEDRVAIGRGKKQIYGSQIGTDMNTKLNYILPLQDPDNVDKRRAKVGLQPLADYVSYWQIKWDIEQYKKDLLIIEVKEKALHK
jgi:hypothetical protein